MEIASLPSLGNLSLPTEMWLEALNYLSASQLARMLTVSRRWKQLTQNPVLWRDVRVWSADVNLFRELLSRAGSLTVGINISVGVVKDMDHASLFAIIAGAMPRVSRLSIELTSKVDSDDAVWVELFNMIDNTPAPALKHLWLPVANSQNCVPRTLFDGIAPTLHSLWLHNFAILNQTKIFDGITYLMVSQVDSTIGYLSLPPRLERLSVYLWKEWSVPPRISGVVPVSLQQVIIDVDGSIDCLWSSLWTRLRTGGYTGVPSLVLHLEWQTSGSRLTTAALAALWAAPITARIDEEGEVALDFVHKDDVASHAVDLKLRYPGGQIPVLLEPRNINQIENLVWPDRSFAIPPAPVGVARALRSIIIECGHPKTGFTWDIFLDGLARGYRLHAPNVREVTLIRPERFQRQPPSIVLTQRLRNLFSSHLHLPFRALPRLVIMHSKGVQLDTDIETSEDILSEFVSGVHYL